MLLYPRASATPTRGTRWAEIRDNRLLLYPTTALGILPVEYRSVAEFIRDEPPGRYLTLGLQGNGWLESNAVFGARKLRKSAGRNAGTFKEVGSRYFVDASVFGIKSFEEFVEVDAMMRDLGLHWKSSPGAVLLQEFLSQWYGAAFWAGPDQLNEDLVSCDVGGLTQCYRYGKRNHRVVLDENSAYGARALGSIPGAFAGVHQHRPRTASCFYVRARVKNRLWAPSLGYRAHGGGCFFPAGSFATVVPEPEIAYAESIGYRIEPLEYYEYTRTAALTEFVSWVYEQRQGAESESSRGFFRRGLQSFLGKFSQRPVRRFLEWDFYEWQGHQQERSQPWYQPHVGGWIHGLQRVALHRAATECDEWPDLVDTDALMVPSVDSAAVPMGSGMGRWKVAREGPASILGARAYWCEKQCLAGYSQKIESESQFLEVARRLDAGAVDARHLPLIATAPAIAVGWQATDRALTGTLETRPWQVSEVELGIPYQVIGDSRRRRLSAFA